MKKVYVLEIHYSDTGGYNPGNYVMGVFSTEEKAKERGEKLLKEEYYDNDYFENTYEITQLEMDKL